MILDNIWVINLDKSKDRLEKITFNLNSLDLKFNRFSAIYGKNLSNEIINDKTNIYCRNLLCNYGIVGCGLSHLELWKKLVNSDSKYFMILEDDVKLNNNSIKIINKLENIIDEYSIDWINLGCIDIGCFFIQTTFEIDEYKFGRPIFPLRTGAYIITKSGANKLLQNITEITYHIDFDIAIKNFYIKFNYYSSNIPIIEYTDDESTIATKNNSLIINFLNTIGLNYFGWILNIPIITINFLFEINILLIILLLLLVINNYFIKNYILLWFIILEIVLLNINQI